MTRAATSRRWPRAHAICDRCGFRYNHDELQWQFQWAGPKLQNLRLLVCQTCLDIPQEGLRTIILPPDPVPIQNPRPEHYETANNPNSPIGLPPIAGLPTPSIGTLIGGGGLDSAFDGNTLKTFAMSANLTTSNSSFNNWVGKDWGFDASTGQTTGLALVVTGFTANAPRDTPFLASGPTNWALQGSSDAGVTTSVDLATGATAGTAGEAITVSGIGGSAYEFHRFVLSGDGTAVAIAQLSLNTNRGTSIL